MATKPPTFVVFVNDPELMHFPYERFLENQIRAAFDFEGHRSMGSKDDENKIDMLPRVFAESIISGSTLGEHIIYATFNQKMGVRQIPISMTRTTLPTEMWGVFAT